jgi:hypothetical protein
MGELVLSLLSCVCVVLEVGELFGLPRLLVIENSFPGATYCVYLMRRFYVDMGHTAYYGIGDFKFRKFLE